MNKNFFIAILVIGLVLLVGWVYYINTIAAQPAPLERIQTDWWGSGHADVRSISFNYWNEDDPPLVPENCAKCHSGSGFIDYIGQDGSEAMAVDQLAAVSSPVSCFVCHNEKADQLAAAQFPSGVQVAMQPGDVLCGTCHSGLSAGSRVDSVSEGFSDDEVVPDTRLVTPHYAYAAATWLGSEAGGGYEYPGKLYVGRFEHANGVETCTQCHDPHSTRIRKDFESNQPDLCAACHSNVTGYADYKDIYVKGADYDGDGLIEGTFHEIEGTRDILYQAIQSYAKQVIKEPVGWADRNPFLYKDTNDDGIIDSSEAVPANTYSSLTPRLMRAAFNYQFSIKDPAGYVHNGRYILQLLVDAIQDISSVTEFQAGNLARP